jgi:hypothetical protein
MQIAGLYTKETARELLQAYRQLKSAGLLQPGVIQKLIRGRPEFTEAPRHFTNVSGETAPPYACMQIVGTEVVADQLFLQVDKPTDTAGAEGAYIFNWHYEVEDGRQGVAQKHEIVRAYSNGDTATAADKWRPVIGDWTIEQDDGGIFTMCGDDLPASETFGFPVVRVAVDGGGQGSSTIGYTIDSISTAGTSSPYNGKVIASVTVVTAPCSRAFLIGTSVDVVDWSGCIFDLSEAELEDVFGWADENVALSLATTAEAGDLTPCHWAAINRCCATGEGA